MRDSSSSGVGFGVRDSQLRVSGRALNPKPYCKMMPQPETLAELSFPQEMRKGSPHRAAHLPAPSPNP